MAAFTPRAVALNIDLMYVCADGRRAYVTCGDDDARAFAGRPPAEGRPARALFVSEPEALGLTGADERRGRRPAAGARVPSAIVTLGVEGRDRGLIERRARAGTGARRLGQVVDATGAGDLLVAAYIWADQPGVRSRSACAGRSSTRGCRSPRRRRSPARSSCAELLEEGRRRG